MIGGYHDIMKYHGPKEMSDAAKSPVTSQEELNNLANSEYIFVRVAVAENPNTPVHTLSRLIPEKLGNTEKLKADHDKWLENNDKWKIVGGLLRNPKLSNEFFIKIAELLKPVLSDIAPRAFCPINVIKMLSKSNSAPTEALLILADASNVPKHIRHMIAEPNTNEVLLKHLVTDPSEKVQRRAINALRKKVEVTTIKPIELENIQRPVPKKQLRIIQLLQLWNPNMINTDENTNEYDGYLPEIIRMLDAGVSQKDLFKHMKRIVEENMRYPFDRDFTKKIAHEIVKFWKE